MPHGILPGLLEPGAIPPATDDENPMDFLIPNAYAQGAGGAAPSNPFITFLPLIVLFGIFYFLMIRPQMKRQKELRKMIADLATGDEVVTNGGLAGRVDDLGDGFLTLEIASGVKVKVQRQAISAVLPKGTLKVS